MAKILLSLLVASSLFLTACGNDSKPSSKSEPLTNLPKLKGVEKTKRLFRDIPQKANLLGNPEAPVSLHEYLDLSCPACAKFSTIAFPKLIRKQVKNGEIKVVTHHFAFVNRASTQAAKVAVLASRHNKMYEFMELYYLNQPSEKAKFNPLLVKAILKSLALPEDLVEKSQKFEVKTLDESLGKEKLKIPGTPSFALVGPKKRYFMSGAVSYAQLSQAIRAAH